MTEKQSSHLTPVPTVERLHYGKQHLNTLSDRIHAVVEEFGHQVAAQGRIVTHAEIIGCLELVKADFIERCK